MCDHVGLLPLLQEDRVSVSLTHLPRGQVLLRGCQKVQRQRDNLLLNVWYIIVRDNDGDEGKVASTLANTAKLIGTMSSLVAPALYSPASLRRERRKRYARDCGSDKQKKKGSCMVTTCCWVPGNACSRLSLCTNSALRASYPSLLLNVPFPWPWMSCCNVHTNCG